MSVYDCCMVGCRPTWCSAQSSRRRLRRSKLVCAPHATPCLRIADLFRVFSFAGCRACEVHCGEGAAVCSVRGPGLTCVLCRQTEFEKQATVIRAGGEAESAKIVSAPLFQTLCACISVGCHVPHWNAFFDDKRFRSCRNLSRAVVRA